MRRAKISGLAIAALFGCAHDAEPGARAGTTDAQFFYYGDNQGLSVITGGARAEQPLTESVAVNAQALVDRIKVVRPPLVVTDSGGQPTGHLHLPNGQTVPISPMDAISSASVSVTGGDRLEKMRFEGTLGASCDRDLAGAPTRFEAAIRSSWETDYKSYSGRIAFRSELFERNTTLTAYAGYGYDRIDPIQAPPGEIDRWPASHDRWIGGATVSQILSPSAMLSGGFGIGRQAGTLSSPYRQARILLPSAAASGGSGTLYPEHLPSERLRTTPFVTLSWYLGWDTALHLRQGGYFDDWGVKAWIPEAVVVKDFGERVQLSLRYRYYLQSRASFYEAIYTDLEAIRTGDPRLGPIENHAPGFDLAWAISGDPGRPGSIAASVGYALNVVSNSELEHAGVAGRAVGHVVQASASASY